MKKNERKIEINEGYLSHVNLVMASLSLSLSLSLFPSLPPPFLPLPLKERFLFSYPTMCSLLITSLCKVQHSS